MSNNHISKQNEINGRISLLLFHCVLMGLFLWAERVARYRYDYVFRKMLPWILPVLLLLALGGMVACILAARRKKEGKGLFSPAFGAYLLAAPVLATAFPLLSYAGQGLQMFKLAVESASYLLIGYFLCYILYYKVKPAAAVLCGLITAEAALTVFYYEMQLSAATGILNAPEFGYLTPLGNALVNLAILAVMSGAVMLLGKVDRFSLKKLDVLVPLILSAVYMFLHLIVSFSFSVRQILLWCYVGLAALWLIISCLRMKREK